MPESLETVSCEDLMAELVARSNTVLLVVQSDGREPKRRFAVGDDSIWGMYRARLMARWAIGKIDRTLTVLAFSGMGRIENEDEDGVSGG